MAKSFERPRRRSALLVAEFDVDYATQRLACQPPGYVLDHEIGKGRHLEGVFGRHMWRDDYALGFPEWVRRGQGFGIGDVECGAADRATVQRCGEGFGVNKRATANVDEPSDSFMARSSA